MTDDDATFTTIFILVWVIVVGRMVYNEVKNRASDSDKLDS